MGRYTLQHDPRPVRSPLEDFGQGFDEALQRHRLTQREKELHDRDVADEEKRHTRDVNEANTRHSQLRGEALEDENRQRNTVLSDRALERQRELSLQGIFEDTTLDASSARVVGGSLVPGVKTTVRYDPTRDVTTNRAVAIEKAKPNGWELNGHRYDTEAAYTAALRRHHQITNAPSAFQQRQLQLLEQQQQEAEAGDMAGMFVDSKVPAHVATKSMQMRYPKMSYARLYAIVGNAALAREKAAKSGSAPTAEGVASLAKSVSGTQGFDASDPAQMSSFDRLYGMTYGTQPAAGRTAPLTMPDEGGGVTAPAAGGGQPVDRAMPQMTYDQRLAAMRAAGWDDDRIVDELRAEGFIK